MDIKQESLKKHYEWKGKIGVASRVKINSKQDLALAYTPGVAEPCLEIEKDAEKSYSLTNRHNTVAVITDGTAVLGLGDIGPLASMPVMEGKCLLFKEFADIDAIPLCINSKDVNEIVNTIKLISGSFGGINLEDISAPRCFEIERILKEKLDIPVFHDDQHGTAIVLAAALINALKVVKKELADIKVVINGAGSAGIAIAKHILALGVKDLILCDKQGIINKETAKGNPAWEEMASITNKQNIDGILCDAVKNADVLIGVSAAGAFTEEIIKLMNTDAIVFAMANPNPEIMPDVALKAGARVVGTGRSDFNNQINNLLAFPGIFRGALDAKAKCINDEMKMAASFALASIIPENELKEDNIIVSPLNKNVAQVVAKAVKEAAEKTKVTRG